MSRTTHPERGRQQVGTTEPDIGPNAGRWRARRFRAILATIVVSAALLGAVAVPGPASAQGGDAADYMSRINELRASRGLAPLAHDPELASLAQSWTQHMAAEGRLSHSPDLSAGVTSSWTKLGENVGFGASISRVFAAFVDSPAHLANLTDPAFTHVGIAVVWTGDRHFTTHRFRAAGGGGAPPPPPPPPPPPAEPAPPRPTAPPPPPRPAPPPTAAPAPPVADAAASEPAPGSPEAEQAARAQAYEMIRAAAGLERRAAVLDALRQVPA